MHWGLTETPFRGGIDPKFFYESPTHEEAMARLLFLVEERQRLGMVLGETGTGKSMLLEVVARHLRRGGSQVANITLPGADLREFLWLIAAELGLNPSGRDDVFRLWRGIIDRLAENRYQQLDTVFLFDDAHDASREVLEHVLRLAQVDRSPASRVAVVLSSSTGHGAALDARLLELLDLRVDLDRWEQLDTIGYLNWSLSQAGRKTPAFGDDAMIRIHSLSDGIPRRVNQLASLALMAGAARQLKLVDGETVSAIQHELNAVETAA
jgi:type II secretory pathway predicted ATPase ExeA